MKVFCLAPNPHANGAGLNFKSGFRPSKWTPQNSGLDGLNFKGNLRLPALACFAKRENFKNFEAQKRVTNQAAMAKATNRAAAVRSLGSKACIKATDLEAVSARHAGYTCRGTKTASAMPIDAAVSKNISNLAAPKHCTDRKNFKIFASDEIKFAMHGELKFATRSMAKFAARCGLKFEPCGTAARGFTTRDKILNSSSRKNCVRFKISPPRDAEKRQNEI